MSGFGLFWVVVASYGSFWLGVGGFDWFWLTTVILETKTVASKIATVKYHKLYIQRMFQIFSIMKINIAMALRRHHSKIIMKVHFYTKDPGMPRNYQNIFESYKSKEKNS